LGGARPARPGFVRREGALGVAVSLLEASYKPN
jgi:hypothetical protein